MNTSEYEWVIDEYNCFYIHGKWINTYFLLNLNESIYEYNYEYFRFRIHSYFETITINII